EPPRRVGGWKLLADEVLGDTPSNHVQIRRAYPHLGRNCLVLPPLAFRLRAVQQCLVRLGAAVARDDLELASVARTHLDGVSQPVRLDASLERRLPLRAWARSTVQRAWHQQTQVDELCLLGFRFLWRRDRRLGRLPFQKQGLALRRVPPDVVEVLLNLGFAVALVLLEVECLFAA